MRTRCKFRVEKVAKVAWSPTAEEVTLGAVYENNPEDVSFSEATPSGSMTFLVTNPKVIDSFVPGKYYYIDLIPVE